MRGNIFIFLCRNGTPEGRKVVKWNVEETYTWLRKQNAVYEDYIVSGLCKPVVYEPRKWVCAQRRLRSAWASAQSDQSSLWAWRNVGSLATDWAHSEDSDQTGCPGWSESSLGVHSFCWFLSCRGSYYLPCKLRITIMLTTHYTLYQFCGWLWDWSLYDHFNIKSFSREEATPKVYGQLLNLDWYSLLPNFEMHL